MLGRRLGAILRGKATPLQLFLACLLGSLIGFVPSIETSWGLLLAEVLLLLMLQANLGIALFVSAVARVLSLLMMPLSFQIGRVLLDGPTRGVFEVLVDTPVTALFGLEYYATTGSLVSGLVVGTVLGLLVVKGIGAFRRRMAGIEQGSDRFRNLSGKPWYRFLMWLLVGPGHGKLTYGDLTARRARNPVRPLGVVVAGLVVLALWILPPILTRPPLTHAARVLLEDWNGATVDLEAVELDLGAGRLQARALALADPNALGQDLFRADELLADLSGTELFKGKFVIDQMVVKNARIGAPRETPGELTDVDLLEWAMPPGTAERMLDEYTREAQEWYRRFRQGKRFVDKVDPDERIRERLSEDSLLEDVAERLMRQVRREGWAHVRSKGLARRGPPALFIKEMLAEGVPMAALDERLVDLRLENVSTDPDDVEEPVLLRLDAQDESLELAVTLDGDAEDRRVRFVRRGIPGDQVSSWMSRPLLRGGTVDLALAGSLDEPLDLPLEVTLHDVLVQVTPEEGRRFTRLALPFTLKGSWDALEVEFDEDDLKDALKTGVKEDLRGSVTDQVRTGVEDVLGQDLEGTGLDEVLDEEVGEALDDLFGDDDDDDKKKKKKKGKKGKQGGADD